MGAKSPTLACQGVFSTLLQCTSFPDDLSLSLQSTTFVLGDYTVSVVATVMCAYAPKRKRLCCLTDHIMSAQHSNMFQN